MTDNKNNFVNHYHRTIDGKTHYWDVKRLIEASRSEPEFSVDIHDIAAIKENFWFQRSLPSIENCVEHFKRIQSADLSQPIILGPDDELIDGAHRLARAMMEDKKSLQAVKLKTFPKPDAILRGHRVSIRRNPV